MAAETSLLAGASAHLRGVFSDVSTGLAYKARIDVADDLAHGRLVALCPVWITEPVPLYMVLPDRRQLTLALRLLHEFGALQCTGLL